MCTLRFHNKSYSLWSNIPASPTVGMSIIIMPFSTGFISQLLINICSNAFTLVWAFTLKIVSFAYTLLRILTKSCAEYIPHLSISIVDNKALHGIHDFHIVNMNHMVQGRGCCHYMVLTHTFHQQNYQSDTIFRLFA